MKDKWHHLPLPQRVLLLLQAFLVVLFLILYATFGRQQVIEYHNTLFRCRTDGDTTVYSGTLDGEKAVFTVSPGPVVEFRWGDALYGPYIITEDSTAIPEQQAMPEFFTSSEYLTGVEVRRGSDVLFRGACHILGGSLSFLIAEDGSYDSFSVSVIADSNTKPEPSVRSILRIALAPELTQRGQWYFFFLGVICCAICTVSILFADDLFRFHLQFRVKYPEDAEPSDWELFTRWVGWIVLTIAALIICIVGLSTP